MMGGSTRRLLALLVGCQLLLGLAQAFRDGDYIHTSRKAQFMARRTNWQDLVGEHCPRFGKDRMVALPIPEPQVPFEEGDTYKIQLSFNGDRHLTQWLPVLGKDAAAVPFIVVTLRRSGDEILGVAAEVGDAPPPYKERHPVVAAQLRNASHWPKHVLLQYQWATQNDVDLDRGLAVLFAVGLAAVVLLMINALRGMHTKLALFLQEVTAEVPMGPAGVSVWKGTAKGD